MISKMNFECLESVLIDLNSHFEEYKKSNRRSLSDRYDIRTYTKAILYYINREIKDHDELRIKTLKSEGIF